MIQDDAKLVRKSVIHVSVRSADREGCSVIQDAPTPLRVRVGEEAKRAVSLRAQHCGGIAPFGIKPALGLQEIASNARVRVWLGKQERPVVVDADGAEKARDDVALVVSQRGHRPEFDAPLAQERSIVDDSEAGDKLGERASLQIGLDRLLVGRRECLCLVAQKDDHTNVEPVQPITHCRGRDVLQSFSANDAVAGSFEGGGAQVFGVEDGIVVPSVTRVGEAKTKQMRTIHLKRALDGGGASLAASDVQMNAPHV